MEFRLKGRLIFYLISCIILLAVVLVEGATPTTSPLYRLEPIPVESFKNRADNEVKYRLPNNTEPIDYEVELTTNVHNNGERKFTGIVKITLRAIEDTRTIVVHARQTTNFVATAKNQNDSNAGDIKLLVDNYDKITEFLSLTPENNDTSFLKDTIYVVTISYTGELRIDNGGFYLSKYNDSNNEIRYLATTQFESTNARHAFPCYDEPAKRATFTIKIRHDKSYTAISNTPVDTEKSSDGYTVFQKTKEMSTYLVAFIVSDFVSTEGALNNLPQRVFSRPGTEHQQEWALVSGMLIVQRLAEYFGIEFAFPKLDQVAVPDFQAGAMENWGLVTYRESALLYDIEQSTTSTQTSIANIISHEYTHQWFGNLVAIKWWSYLWLKEGFATIYSYQGVDDAYPEWDVFQMFQVSDYQNALSVDAINNSRPMTYYIEEPNAISMMYDSISYAKAGCVLQMWQHALPNYTFQVGLNNYLTRNQFKAAADIDLFNAIQDAAKQQNVPTKGRIEEMMGSWTNQGGYPVLIVERNYDNGSFIVKQQPFYNDIRYNKTKSWWIPFNFVTKSNSDFRDTTATHYLENTENVTINNIKLNKDEWLILNKQSTGYYRVLYDKRNYELITDSLRQQPHKISPRNRAQLLHDAYRFMSTNHLEHEILMELLTYLKNENEYAPWTTANSILVTFNRYLSGDKSYDNFKTFLAELVGPKHDEFGVNDVNGEQHLRKLTRSTLMNLACLAEIQDCLNATNQKLKEHVYKNKKIEPNQRTPVYCNGLRQSGDEEFNFLYDELMHSNDQAHRNLLISSLGCSQKGPQIEKFINSSIDNTNNLRAQERPTLLSKVYTRGEMGLLACINFLDKNWEAYSELPSGFTGMNTLEVDIRSMAQYTMNDDQKKKLLELVDKVKDSPNLSKRLKSDVEDSIQSNFDWLKENRDPLMTWINSNIIKSGSSSLAVSYILVAIIGVWSTRLF